MKTISNISPFKTIIFNKSSKINQNPSRYYNSITNLNFQHNPKYHVSKILLTIFLAMVRIQTKASMPKHETNIFTTNASCGKLHNLPWIKYGWGTKKDHLLLYPMNPLLKTC